MMTRAAQPYQAGRVFETPGLTICISEYVMFTRWRRQMCQKQVNVGEVRPKSIFANFNRENNRYNRFDNH